MNSCSHVQSRRVFNHNDSKVQFQHIYIPDLCLSRFKREKSTHPCGVNFCGLFKKSYLSSFSFFEVSRETYLKSLNLLKSHKQVFLFFWQNRVTTGGQKVRHLRNCLILLNPIFHFKDNSPLAKTPLFFRFMCFYSPQNHMV